jgi:hypothetical protein
LTKKIDSKSTNDDAEHDDDDDDDEAGDHLGKLTVILYRKGTLILFFFPARREG